MNIEISSLISYQSPETSCFVVVPELSLGLIRINKFLVDLSISFYLWISDGC